MYRQKNALDLGVLYIRDDNRMKRGIVETTVNIDVQDICYLKESTCTFQSQPYKVIVEVIKQHKLIKIEHQLVHLTSSRVGYGKRYWFECPSCCERTKKLYITASRHVWRCRKCHNLTYFKSNLSGNEFRYVDYQIQVLQKELQVTKENSYSLLGITDIMIERVPIFKPRYMRQTKFDDKKLILELMICRRVELWMRSIRF